MLIYFDSILNNALPKYKKKKKKHYTRNRMEFRLTISKITLIIVPKIRPVLKLGILLSI